MGGQPSQVKLFVKVVHGEYPFQGGPVAPWLIRNDFHGDTSQGGVVKARAASGPPDSMKSCRDSSVK